ncbi:MAG: NgoBV family restriction endonuclease [Methanobacteriaceae archaeon]
MKASKLYENLLTNIRGEKGNIYFKMAGICLKVEETDTVGKTLQEWLKEYLKINDYFFREPEHTQTFPDFFLAEDNDKDMLEIKSFHYSKTPAFDIANFDSYCGKIKNDPYCLYSDYLIFGYEMTNGNISIEEIWLKKIWEIAGTSARYPLKTQVKKDMIYNIRPNSEFKKNQEGVFKDEISFLKAVYGTIQQYKSEADANDWKKTFCENYKKHYGCSLSF